MIIFNDLSLHNQILYFHCLNIFSSFPFQNIALFLIITQKTFLPLPCFISYCSFLHSPAWPRCFPLCFYNAMFFSDLLDFCDCCSYCKEGSSSSLGFSHFSGNNLVPLQNAVSGSSFLSQGAAYFHHSIYGLKMIPPLLICFSRSLSESSLGHWHLLGYSSLSNL